MSDVPVCFEEEPDTVYEEWLEEIHRVTGMCFCNLCQSQGWGGYKQKEQGEYYANEKEDTTKYVDPHKPDHKG